MMQIRGHDIGVCSWSLRPSGLADLGRLAESLGVRHVQLALGGLLAMDPAAQDAEIEALRATGLTVTASMIGFPGEDYATIAMIRRTGGFVPDDTWPQRRDLALAAADLTRRLGLTRLTTHVGFIPPSSDAGYAAILARIEEVAAHLEQQGLELLMETGQESAPELLQFLNDVRARNVGVNFDPANMILYGSGDPIDAVHTLGRHIRHVHVKDAVASDQPKLKWGDEVPFGHGQVDPGEFLAALRDVGYAGPLVIEREAGETRMADVRAAIAALQSA